VPGTDPLRIDGSTRATQGALVVLDARRQRDRGVATATTPVSRLRATRQFEIQV
jgi:hypothetical protein